MILKEFVLGELENNNYLLIDEVSKEAILIDCTIPREDIEDALKEYNANLKYILLTHAHFDHIMGVNYFREKYHCKALLHIDDKELLESIKDFAREFLPYDVEKQQVDDYIEENQVIKFGGKDIKVIHTPGHTKGGVCYLLDDMLFSGDTIFREAVGRTDLPGGNFAQLKSNIEQKIFTLDENIKIYPGHGPSSTVGWEKVHNQFL